MARAMARGRKPEAPEPHDAVTERLLEAAEWARHHARALIVGLVVVGLAVAAIVYYVDYRQTVESQAAVELQNLAGELQATEPAEAASRLQAFIDRYSGTEATDEARLFLARMHLSAGEPERAIEVLEPLSDAAADMPLGFGARSLLAAAHEANGQPERAMETYAALGREARYPFQRRRARADRARLMVDAGRLAEAEQVFAALVSEAEAAEGAEAEAAEYRVRLAEVRARLAAGDVPEPSGAESDAASDASGADDPPAEGAGSAAAASDTISGGR